MSTTYQTNFIPPSSQTPQTPDLVPIYAQQPVQMIYPPPQPNQQNPLMYPNQGPVMYTQNPVYHNTLYQTPPCLQQNLAHYPQSTSTPNSCTSSVSNTAYCRQMADVPIPPANYNQMTQNMSHLNISSSQMSLISNSNQHNYSCAQNQKVVSQQMQYFEGRQKNCTPKGNKFSTPKNFIMCSSQSSTGTNSPATTVIAGYCNNQGLYRTPPETPPMQNMAVGYGPNFVPPVLYRQVSALFFILCLLNYRLCII